MSDITFIGLPPRGMTFSSFEDLAEWYRQNPGRIATLTNVQLPGDEEDEDDDDQEWP
jgi:hypothetical protein